MTMCLSCELFACEGCDSYDALPEYGCCCGRIQPDHDDWYGDDDFWDEDDD